MQVVHGLAAIFALIDNKAVTRFGETLLFRHLLCCVEKVQVVARFGQGGKTLDLLSWNNKDMSGRDRIDVAKRDAMVILVDDVGRNLALHDLGEQSRHGFILNQSIRIMMG